MSKLKLDRSQPFATVSSMDEDMLGIAYRQDGWFFSGSDETAVKEVPGFKKKPKKSEAAIKAATAKVEKADRAAAILGNLGMDPNADARRENAAAAQAESLSDDAQSLE